MSDDHYEVPQGVWEFPTSAGPTARGLTDEEALAEMQDRVAATLAELPDDHPHRAAGEEILRALSGQARPYEGPVHDDD